MDILLLKYLDEHYDQASPEVQSAFVQMLEQQDDVLWDWLSGQSSPDEPSFANIIDRIIAAD